ncbi:MAG: SRPBCC domain-containing protein [Acidimicrobiia bacterium]|nr:SRPBCC domain-containing protein [Acidimicrobiia bacterium]
MAEIIVHQHIKASPSTVYRYLTEAERWTQWQGESATIDAREGGIFSIVMANGMNARGQFTDLVPDKRLTFTWGWVDRPGIPPGSTLVTIELQDEDGGTLLVLTHSDLPDDETSSHREGWLRHLPQLARVAEG